MRCGCLSSTSFNFVASADSNAVTCRALLHFMRTPPLRMVCVAHTENPASSGRTRLLCALPSLPLWLPSVRSGGRILVWGSAWPFWDAPFLRARPFLARRTLHSVQLRSGVGLPAAPLSQAARRTRYYAKVPHRTVLLKSEMPIKLFVHIGIIKSSLWSSIQSAS